MAEITEWTFAADVAKWMTLYLQGRPSSPFSDAKVEIKSRGSQRRCDLALYDRDERKALTGEIKFPDTKDGQTPFNGKVVADARHKARRAKAPYFFSWNVNRLVLWATGEEHELKRFDVVSIRRHEELEFASVQRQIRDDFIPRFLEEYARVYRGEESLGVLPLDQRFIGRLESALHNISNTVFAEAFERYQHNSRFRKELDGWMRAQEWLISDDEQTARDNVDRAVRLGCYITANKLVFYQALRRSRRFKLPKLTVPAHTDTAERLRDHFGGMFHQAKMVTRDYQTIFDGDYIDRVPFIMDSAVERWRTLVDILNEFDFRQFDQDVIGHIFEDLLSPEEKHRWGQHYTKPEIVDVINAFCIRRADAVVLDPASGSGTFPVRAYARKKHLARGALSHAGLLSQLYACEISDYAGHLTSLNLATRDLIDGENFPLVARADFFDTRREKPFCAVPDATAARIKYGDIATRDVSLVRADAIIGNPPYLRQEEIGKKKGSYYDLVREEWPGLKLSGRSDLHIYFWPHAAKLLPEGGYFGFLTSSSWLDVEYGFHLQRWILQNFELIAVMESNCEPWFTGARVATCVTILRRCSDPAKRAQNPVRFMQLRKPVKELLENDGTETGRQEAAERLRDLIEGATKNVRSPDYRILVVPQQKLWDDGCKVGEIPENGENGNGEENSSGISTQTALREEAAPYRTFGEYHGGKWGIYLRAPDLYFELMQKYGGTFAPLEKGAEIRYAVKSGCDAFFFPRLISKEALELEPDADDFRKRFRCNRREVISEAVQIIRAGDGSEHPIESKFLKPVFVPEDDIKNIQVSESQNRQRVLWVGKTKVQLRGTHVLNYIKYGTHENFGDGARVPEKPTCAARERENHEWYDLTDAMGTRLLMPKGQQYGNIVFCAAEPMLANSRVYNLAAASTEFEKPLAAILNSTLAALYRCLYGRTLGREGAADIMVVDVKMMPAPDPAKASAAILSRLGDALDEIGNRQILPFLETAFAECSDWKKARAMAHVPVVLPPELQSPDRQRLDDAVLELIGVAGSNERTKLRDRLYQEIALFYRQIRLLELQAMENRRRAQKGKAASPREMAREIFETLDPALIRRFPESFLPEGETLETVELPEGKPKLFDEHDFYDSKALAIGTHKLTLRHRAQAELAKLYCDLHRTGFAQLPLSEKNCAQMQRSWEKYFSEMQTVFRRLAAERTEDEDRQEAIIVELNRLLVFSPPQSGA
jgi:type I restriction-modification system DNA methylase subunit